MRVESGFYTPGMAPLGEGHQPPLSYWLGAGVLRLFLSPDEVSSFVDYQAGVMYSSEGKIFGGSSPCSYRLRDLSEAPKEAAKFRRAIWALRSLNGILLGLTAVLAALASLSLFPGHRLLAFSAGLLVGAAPTAIWRSALVTNDNAVAFFGSLAFVIGLALVVDKGGCPLSTDASGERFLYAWRFSRSIMGLQPLLYWAWRF